MMKYHTLSTSSLAAEGKSTLTIYTQPEFVREKMESTATALVRCELEMAQRALKLQTRRCRQLVSEFTRKLQAKELEALTERHLRDQQLTKVLRSLLVFEARLKQEQTFIKHQLNEKDDIIQRQRKEIGGLRNLVQFCNTCSRYYKRNKKLRRPTMYKSCESSTEGSASSAERSPSSAERSPSSASASAEEIEKVSERIEQLFETQPKFSEKMDMFHGIKKSAVLDASVAENLTNEEKEINKNRISETISVFDSGDGENNSWYASASDQEDDDKQIYRNNPVLECMNQILLQNINDVIHSPPKTPELTKKTQKRVKFSDENSAPVRLEPSEPVRLELSAPVHLEQGASVRLEPSAPVRLEPYEPVRLDQNAPVRLDQSAPVRLDQSAPVRLEQSAPVRLEPKGPVRLELNAPVRLELSAPVRLEPSVTSEPCATSEPRVTTQLRVTTQPRVSTQPCLTTQPCTHPRVTSEPSYYETPIQQDANFYEVPQSIYSNDYEQILSKSGENIHNWKISSSCKIENLQENKINRMSTQKLTIAKCNNLDDEKSHYYIDMDTTTTTNTNTNTNVNVSPRKTVKISKSPPALPPKPANLVSKFKLQNVLLNREELEQMTVDSEPDYCSISELNLPTEKMIMSKNTANLDKINASLYDPITLDGTLTTLAAQNSAKIASITQINMLKKHEPEIPKLPQVSEIIIPEETDKEEQKMDISQDNYIKNNSQILKRPKNKITIGTSVSSLISNFNNYKNPERYRLFSNFENQNYEKQKHAEKITPSFDFDLSQNFEEFNLDDCEIGEDYHYNNENNEDIVAPPDVIKEAATAEIKPSVNTPVNTPVNIPVNTSVEIVRATKDVCHRKSLQNIQLQKNSTTQKTNNASSDNESLQIRTEPSYEHFLECTGLSSKSILTPSRMLSNHKSMLKPKDIKLRSRVKSAAGFEQSHGTVKYWSEPYL